MSFSQSQSVHMRASFDIAHVYYISRFPLLTPLRFSVLLGQNQNVVVFNFCVLLSKTSAVHKE